MIGIDAPSPPASNAQQTLQDLAGKIPLAEHEGKAQELQSKKLALSFVLLPQQSVLAVSITPGYEATLDVPYALTCRVLPTQLQMPMYCPCLLHSSGCEHHNGPNG